MGKTLIFTATYNEKENIKKLIYDINKINKDIDILVIDDNSPDKTWEVLHQLERNLPNLKVIIRDDKSGLDTAHKLAYQYALDRFSVGAATSLQFSQAKQRYDAAISAELRAKFDAIFRIKVLEFYFGIPLTL